MQMKGKIACEKTTAGYAYILHPILYLTFALIKHLAFVLSAAHLKTNNFQLLQITKKKKRGKNRRQKNFHTMVPFHS